MWDFLGDSQQSVYFLPNLVTWPLVVRRQNASVPENYAMHLSTGGLFTFTSQSRAGAT